MVVSYQRDVLGRVRMMVSTRAMEVAITNLVFAVWSIVTGEQGLFSRGSD